MWRQRLVFVCILVVIVSLVSSEERSRDYEEKSRKARLFTFNTVDEDIKLDLQFTIPFISIPAKKAVDTVHGMWSGTPAININPATLAVGGAIVLGTTVLLPFALKSYAQYHSQYGYSRLLDSAEFSTDAFLDFAGQILANGKSVQSCTLRVACWTGQNSNVDQIRFLQDVMRNSLLSTVTNSTALEDAMASGRNGRDCSTYSPCPLKEEHIPLLFDNLSAIANSIG